MRLDRVCLWILCAAVPAHAQTRPPAFLAESADDARRLDTRHLTAEAEGPARLGPDGRATVTVRITPKPTMHVYAADADGFVPLSLAIDGGAGVTMGPVRYPSAETYVFPPTGESSRVYMRPIRISVPVIPSRDARAALLARGRLEGTLVLRYQACDDTVCYRPASGRLPFELVR